MVETGETRQVMGKDHCALTWRAVFAHLLSSFPSLTSILHFSFLLHQDCPDRTRDSDDGTDRQAAVRQMIIKTHAACLLGVRWRGIVALPVAGITRCARWRARGVATYRANV